MRGGDPGRRRVVVTGCGAVSAWGWSAGELWRGLVAGTTAIAAPRRFDARGHRTAVAGEVPAEPGARARARRTLAERFAVSAAREACAGARLDSAGAAGVFFASSTGGMPEGERFVRPLLDGEAESEADPLDLRLVASHQMNGPGDAVARDHGATGPVRSISSACSSGTMAIGEALDALRSGEVEAAIAGGADALCDLTYAGFNALRAVDPRPCRPFRAGRQGLSLGEGAGALVLETFEHARRRGAPMLAELLGTGASCDAHHMTAPDPSGRGAARAIAEALDDAGVAPHRIGWINAHGTGTVHNDPSEARAVAAIFGAGAGSIAVTSIKGSVGHLLGAAGAIEAVATVLALVAGEAPPTAGEGELDPEIGLDVVLGAPRRLAAGGCAVSTSLAFGGANAALVFAPLEGAAG